MRNQLLFARDIAKAPVLVFYSLFFLSHSLSLSPLYCRFIAQSEIMPVYHARVNSPLTNCKRILFDVFDARARRFSEKMRPPETGKKQFWQANQNRGERRHSVIGEKSQLVPHENSFKARNCNRKTRVVFNF